MREINNDKADADYMVHLLHLEDNEIKRALEQLYRDLENISPEVQKLLNTVSNKKHGLSIKIFEQNLIAEKIKLLNIIQKVKKYYCFDFWENPDSYKKEGEIKI